MTFTAAPAIPDLSRFIPELRSRRRDGVLAEMVGAAQRAGALRAHAPVLELLRARERVVPSAIARDAALVGARSLGVARPFVVVARGTRGIEWSGAEQGVVHLVVLVLAPAEWTEEAFHARLARAATLVRLQRTRQRLLAGGTGDLVTGLLREAAS